MSSPLASRRSFASSAGADNVEPMGFNWEQVLGTGGVDLTGTYDNRASDALYQDHPRSFPPGMPIDPGGDRVVLPFEEI